MAMANGELGGSRGKEKYKHAIARAKREKKGELFLKSSLKFLRTSSTIESDAYSVLIYHKN